MNNPFANCSCERDNEYVKKSSKKMFKGVIDLSKKLTSVLTFNILISQMLCLGGGAGALNLHKPRL